eukprot:10549460-Alexandrium_andersonii.AAC.1
MTETNNRHNAKPSKQGPITRRRCALVCSSMPHQPASRPHTPTEHRTLTCADTRPLSQRRRARRER